MDELILTEYYQMTYRLEQPYGYLLKATLCSVVLTLM